jgi:hypothetical protein
MRFTHPHPAENVVLQTMDTGSLAFSSLWRGWISQFTQPQLLKLSEVYVGARLFHSSQMGGFATRKLRNPSPAVFMAVGLMNLAHARSVGYPADKIDKAPEVGLPAKLPDSLRSFWEGREPLCDAYGVAMGPSGLFEAFTGLRELSTAPDRIIAPENEAAACAALGKHLRLHYASQGVDWLSELPSLRQQNACLEDVLMGRSVSGDRLTNNIRAIAAITGISEDELWAVTQTA